MNTTQRRHAIETQVNNRGYATIEELSASLGFSPATLRTDLDSLHKQERLIRLRGVALSLERASPYGASAQPARRYVSMEAEKQTIARLCYELIDPSATLFLDTSGSSFLLAEEIARRGNIPLTVITNSLDILSVLRSASHVSLLMAGGDYEAGTNSTVGGTTVDFIRHFHAQAAFVSPMGFDGEGVQVYHARNTNVRKAMLRNATLKVILADHTKFVDVGVEHLCGWSQVTTLVTDAPPPDPFRTLLQRHNIRVVFPQ